MTDSTKRFTDRVTYYIRSRPRYPAALLRFFQNELGLSPSHVVADTGAGTGFLSEPFVRNGNRVFAIEPNDAMRAAADEYLGEWSNFKSVIGTAEATTLADRSVNFITAGQAFHWFDPVKSRAEFARIVVPGGIVALVWNDRRLTGSPFAVAYEKLIEAHAADRATATKRHRPDMEDSGIKSFFAPSRHQVRAFDNPQTVDRQGLIDRLASSSYMPLPPDPRHTEMLHAANALFDEHQQNGTVLIPHDTRVYFGSLSQTSDA